MAGAWPAPSHYLNQCWNIVNWTLRNKFQWNFNRSSNIFIQENELEDLVCEMASTKSRPQCVKFHVVTADVLFIIITEVKQLPSTASVLCIEHLSEENSSFLSLLTFFVNCTPVRLIFQRYLECSTEDFIFKTTAQPCLGNMCGCVVHMTLFNTMCSSVAILRY